MFREIEELRREAETLLLAQYRAQWANWVQGAPLEIAATYEGHGHLFEPSTIERVGQAVRATEGVEALALRFFRNHLLAEHIGRAVAELEDRIMNLQAAASLELDGTSFPFRQLNHRIANEPAADRRRRLSDAAAPIMERLSPLLLEKEKISRDRAEALGWTYLGLSAEIRQADLTALAGQARSLLDRTGGLYHQSLERALPLLGDTGGDGLQGCDLPWLFKGDGFAEYFPADGLMATVRTFLEGIGIDVADQAGLHLHLEDTPAKNPRAVCFPIAVPDDIRLSIKPGSGAMDYRSLFHEMGHAQHFLHTTTPYFEFRHLGSYTTTEVYASLFEGMLEHPDFLERRLGLPAGPLEDYLALTVFQKLFLIRRYAAKILYEMDLHAGVDGPRDRYRVLQEEATGMRLNEVDAERYLLDMDPFFYSADYFRAWQLEAMLDDRLDAGHGAPWFEQAGTREDLRFLWAVGSAQSADELAAGLGEEGPVPGPLLARLNRYIQRSTR